MTFQHFHQLLRPNRLGNVIIHTGFQAAFLVPQHRMSRHGDDGDVFSGLAFDLPNGLCRLQTVHPGHLNIHQDEIKHLLLDRLKSFRAVSRHTHLMPSLLEQPQR